MRLAIINVYDFIEISNQIKAHKCQDPTLSLNAAYQAGMAAFKTSSYVFTAMTTIAIIDNLQHQCCSS
jgi:hypothetical protein